MAVAECNSNHRECRIKKKNWSSWSSLAVAECYHLIWKRKMNAWNDADDICFSPSWPQGRRWSWRAWIRIRRTSTNSVCQFPFPRRHWRPSLPSMPSTSSSTKAPSKSPSGYGSGRLSPLHPGRLPLLGNVSLDEEELWEYPGKKSTSNILWKKNCQRAYYAKKNLRQKKCLTKKIN